MSSKISTTEQIQDIPNTQTESPNEALAGASIPDSRLPDWWDSTSPLSSPPLSSPESTFVEEEEDEEDEEQAEEDEGEQPEEDEENETENQDNNNQHAHLTTLLQLKAARIRISALEAQIRRDDELCGRTFRGLTRLILHVDHGVHWARQVVAELREHASQAGAMREFMKEMAKWDNGRRRADV